MTKTGLLKLIGLFMAPLLIMAVTVYLLYPYINKEKHQQITEKFRMEKMLIQSDEELINGKFQTISEQVESPEEDDPLKSIIDSLRSVDEDLKQKLEQHLDAELEKARVDVDDVRLKIQEQEEFSAKVKTLLSLDEEKLVPILDMLSEEQLIQLYKGGSTIQKRKLLRSLKPDRAAKLISEIMQ